jgi:hypothetical protein
MHPQQVFALWLVEAGHVLKEVSRGFDWVSYFGFSKCSISNFTSLAASFGLQASDDMLNEMVRLTNRVDNGCHVHHATTAVVLFLGVQHGVGDPGRYAQYYLKLPSEKKGCWYQARPGECVLIPPGAIHDFVPHPGRSLYFLSVQNPRLHNPATGEDDFHTVMADCEPFLGVKDTWQKWVKRVKYFGQRLTIPQINSSFRKAWALTLQPLRVAVLSTLFLAPTFYSTVHSEGRWNMEVANLEVSMAAGEKFCNTCLTVIP